MQLVGVDRRPLSELEIHTWRSNRVQCPTRRAARERKASAPTAAGTSRKMEPTPRVQLGARPRRQQRRRRLHPGTIGRAVSGGSGRTHADVCWGGSSVVMLSSRHLHALRRCINYHYHIHHPQHTLERAPFPPPWANRKARFVAPALPV